MVDGTAKPVIFISYSHLDEPEKPGDGEVRWLSFVQKFLRPLEKHGILKTWDDRRIRGGSGWREEISKQLNACDVCILLVSPNSLSSDFILDDEIKRMLERRKEEGAHIYPIVITPTPFKGAEWLTEMQLRAGKTQPLSSYPLSEREMKMVTIVEEIADILEEMTKSGRRTAKIGPAGEVPINSPDIIDIEHLPLTPYKRLVGRDVELLKLDDAWRDNTANVVSLTAWGGAGKTALLNEWLARLRNDNYRGTAAVLGWSFYSQGTQERATSAEGFFDWALGKLNIKADPASSSIKGERLAEAIAKRRVLMVLDGVEPLQHGPGGQQGQLKDQGLRVLLRRFAAIPPAATHGLIILTSRLEIRDIDQWKRSPDNAWSVLTIDLGHLSDDAGADLLTDNGVKGTPRELRAASHEFEGHALALSLLASFLARRHHGDVQRRDRIGPLLQKSDARGHDHAQRVMQAYESEWLKDEPVLTAILRVVGLFDRPATAGCIAALRDRPAIEGLTDTLVDLTFDQWADSVSTLREVHLLDPEEPTAPNVLDAHPLIREWFGERLRQVNEAAWKAAHGRLYEHLRDATKEGEKPTLEQLAPLYQAIAHGCRAERFEDVLDSIFVNRICRRRKDGKIEFYSSHVLGAFGSDLAALSWFFDKRYESPSTKLNKEDQGFVLNVTAVDLRAQGRFIEALPAQRTSFSIAKELTQWSNAAISAADLSETELTLGNVSSAVSTAEQSVAYADQDTREFEKIGTRAFYARALHAAGFGEKAERVFIKAERRQQKNRMDHPLLYSTAGYHYCDLLLAKGRWIAARNRATSTIVIARRQNWPLDIGLDTLTLARSQLGLVLSYFDPQRPAATSRDEVCSIISRLNDAIDALRTAAHGHYIPSGLLARAAFSSKVGDWDAVLRDTNEIRDLAEPTQMRLHLCDMALQEARLAFGQIEAFAPLNGILEADIPPKPVVPGAQQIIALKRDADRQLKIAADYIEKCGYHRRDEELAELQAVLRGERGFADLPPRV